MPKDESEHVLMQFQKISSNRQSFSELENKNFHKDGRIVILETSGVPIYDLQGNFMGYRGIDRDITGRRVKEEKIKEDRNQMQAILDNIPDMAWLKDLNSCYIAVNEAFANSCSRESSEVIGKTE